MTQGTGWCTDIAYSVAPGAPWAWDARTTADAAFGRYVREASDYAGGRRLDPRRRPTEARIADTTPSSPAGTKPRRA